MKELINKLPQRFKSPVFWTGFVLLISDALKLFGVYDIPSDTLSIIQDIITGAFQVFSALNNPTDKNNF